jgi:hypothetical protein
MELIFREKTLSIRFPAWMGNGVPCKVQLRLAKDGLFKFLEESYLKHTPPIYFFG